MKMKARPLWILYAAIPFVAVFAGLLAAILGEFAAVRPAFLLGPPLGLGLLMVLVLDRRLLMIVILSFRASSDVLFNTAKFSLGGYAVGVGGLINAFVVGLAFLLVVENPKALPKRMIVVWIPFLLLGALGVAQSPNTGEALRLYLSQLSYCAAFVSAFYVVRTPEDFRFAVKLVLWSSAIPALYVVVEVLTGGGQRHDGFRPQSTFGHPNIFAFYLTLVIGLAFYLIKTVQPALKTSHRIGLWLYMLYLIALLILTQTRSAWAAFLLMFGLYALLYERRYFFLLALIPLLALLIPGVQDRISDLGQGNDYVGTARLNSFGWRKLMWQSGLEWMDKSRYLFGYGTNSFKSYSVEFFPLANAIEAGAHSVYVELFFELGAAGLLAWLLIQSRILSVLKEMRRVDRFGAFITLTMVIQYLLVSISDNMMGYLAFNWYYWFIIGAACSMTLAARQGSARSEEAGRSVAAQEGARGVRTQRPALLPHRAGRN